MHKTSDVLPASPERSEVDHYKMLTRLAEERAREIRRIAALERACLEKRLLKQEAALKSHDEDLAKLRDSCSRYKASSERAKESFRVIKRELAVTRAQLKSLKKAQDRIAASRAHRIAAAYVRFATDRPFLSRAFQLLRPLGGALARAR